MALLGRSPLRVESVSISMRASYSPYSAWKCAGLWSLKYIRTTIPKNRVTSGISSFDFNPFAPAPSEAASDRPAATPPPSGHRDPRDLRARVGLECRDRRFTRSIRFLEDRKSVV